MKSGPCEDRNKKISCSVCLRPLEAANIKKKKKIIDETYSTQLLLVILIFYLLPLVRLTWQDSFLVDIMGSLGFFAKPISGVSVFTLEKHGNGRVIGPLLRPGNVKTTALIYSFSLSNCWRVLPSTDSTCKILCWLYNIFH